MPLLLNLLVSNSDIHPKKGKSRVTRGENSKSRFILLPITHRAANLGLITHHAFPVVASLAFSEGEKRRPEMRLLFAG